MSKETPQIKSKIAFPGRPPRLKTTPRQKKRMAQQQRISGAIVVANIFRISSLLSYGTRVFGWFEKVVEFLAVVVLMKSIAGLVFLVPMQFYGYTKRDAPV